MAAQKKILTETTFDFPLTFEGKTNLLVKKGQLVSVGEVVAKVKSGASQKVDLAKTLGIKGQKGPRFLVKDLGGRVEKDEVIAQKDSLLGAKKVTSPIDGELISLSEKGVLTIGSPVEVEIKADFAGRVIEASSNQVLIQFPALKVTGDWGVGSTATGLLRVLRPEEGGEDVFKIHADILGKILAVEGKISRAFWFKVLSLKAAGVVCLKLPKDGFRKLLIEQQRVVEKEKKDAGLPPLVVLGTEEDSEAAWPKLKEHEGRKVFIDGKNTQLIIPLKATAG